MGFIIFFLVTMVLIGSGVIGSDIFLLGIIIGTILICIGINIVFADDKKKEDDDK